MPQNQIVGIVMLAIAVIDTTIGNLLVVPRIADPTKRSMIRGAFGISGVIIAGVGIAIYKGLIALG